MTFLIRQSGFYLLMAYCVYILFSFLWFRVEPTYGLYLTLAAAVPYALHRITVGYNKGWVLSRWEMFGILLIGLSGLSLVMHSAFLSPFRDIESVETLDFTVRLWINGVIWFAVGASVSLCRLENSITLALLLVAGFLIPVISALDDNLVINYSLLKYGTELSEYDLSHLATAEFMVLLSFAAFAIGGKVRPLLVIAILFALFASGGRSSFYFSLLSILLFEAFANRQSRILKSAAVVVVIALSVWLAAKLNLFSIEATAVREMLFLGGIENDDSYRERQYLLSESLSALPSQWLHGDPTFIAKKFEFVGSYLHNLLSAWQFFGFPVFAVIVVFLVSSLNRMRVVIARNPSCIEVFGALVLIYTVLSMATSKYVGFYYLWLSMGFWMASGSTGLSRVSQTVERSGLQRFVKKRRRSRRSGSGKRTSTATLSNT